MKETKVIEISEINDPVLVHLLNRINEISFLLKDCKDNLGFERISSKINENSFSSFSATLSIMEKQADFFKSIIYSIINTPPLEDWDKFVDTCSEIKFDKWLDKITKSITLLEDCKKIINNDLKDLKVKESPVSDHLHSLEEISMHASYINVVIHHILNKKMEKYG